MSGRQDHHLWNRATDVAPLALGLQLHIGERQDVSPPIPGRGVIVMAWNRATDVAPLAFRKAG